MRTILRLQLFIILTNYFFLSAMDSVPLVGTWKGKIGKYPITVYFAGSNHYHYGSYYYDKYVTAIGLSNEELPDSITNLYESRWFGDDSCTWLIEKVSDSSAVGKWINQKQTDTLPINLLFIVDDASAYPDSMIGENVEFTLQLDTLVSPTNQKYRTCYCNDDAEVEDLSRLWFELLDTNKAFQKINRLINGHSPYDSGKGTPDCSELSESDCKEIHFERTGREGGVEYTGIKPNFWSKNYLGVTFVKSWLCGDVHHNSESQNALYSLQTGEKVDLSLTRIFHKKFHIVDKYADDPESSSGLNNDFFSILKSKRAPDEKFTSSLPQSEFSITFDSTHLIIHSHPVYVSWRYEEEFKFTLEEIFFLLSDEGKKIVTEILLEREK